MGACVYLLRSTVAPRRTYVGCTVHDVLHRVRQHNGELCGGAAQTRRGRPWVVVTQIVGFRTRTEALQFEYAWRRVHRRRRFAYSVPGRHASLAHLMELPHWSSTSPPASEVPLTVLHHV